LKVLLFISLLLGACLPSPASQNLLRPIDVVQVNGVTHPERLTDNQACQTGDFFQTDRSSWFKDSNSQVIWDLGTNTALETFHIQADNNDDYEIDTSTDGHNFYQTWKVPRVEGSGMQERTTQIPVTARYIKLRAYGGDGQYGVSEIRISDQDTNLAQGLDYQHSLPVITRIQNSFLGFVLCSLLLSFSTRFLRVSFLLQAVTLIAGAVWLTSQAEFLPPSAAMQSLVRACAALIALTAVCRLPYVTAQGRKLLLVPLSIAVLLATLGFTSFLQPQFRNANTGQPRFIHDADMHVYYPVAKYYKELGYDGIYLASALAYMNSTGNLPEGTHLRSLTNDRIYPIKDSLREMDAVRARFSNEQWWHFQQDMAYFASTMGTYGYFDGLNDHGGNATPFWFLVTHCLFVYTTASDHILYATALLDPVLLILLAFVVARSFGLIPMLVCATLFGATDIYMFGTTWAGATLRYDWIACLGFGFCALKVGRWKTGGFFLAISSLIRAFPALTLLAISLPLAYTAGEFLVQQRRLPDKDWLKTNSHSITTLVAAGITITVGALLTVLVFGVHPWVAWLQKVQMLDNGGCVNFESLRMLMSFDPGAAVRGLFGLDTTLDWTDFNTKWNSFHLLRVLIDLLSLGGLMLLTRRLQTYQTAITGLLLLPIIFGPANYYVHSFFLLALLWPTQTRAAIKTWVILLLLCLLQYRTTFIPDTGMHFLTAGFLLLLAYLAIAWVIKAENTTQVEVSV
jgi:hypothetical protein